MQYENIVTMLKEKKPIFSFESIIHPLQKEDNKLKTMRSLQVKHSMFPPQKLSSHVNIAGKQIMFLSIVTRSTSV